MNFTQATNTPIILKLAGARYPIRPLKFRELAPVSAWIEENVPSPLANATLTIHQLRASGKPPDSATEILLLDHALNAMLSWPPRPGTTVWFDALEGVEGGLTELVRVIVSQTVPDFDQARAIELTDKLNANEVMDLIYLGVLGIRLKKDETAESDPEPESAVEPEPIPTPQPSHGATWGVWREA